MPDWPTDTASAPSLPEGHLLECLLTTRDADGGVRVSPMGPIFDRAFASALLRPYSPSASLENLRRDGGGVLHITDDATQIALAAIGQLDAAPRTMATPDGRGAILSDACRWLQVAVEAIDEGALPARVLCRVTEVGTLRDFLGFNRARNALIEAAVLATRVDYLPHSEIRGQLQTLRNAVERTGGRAERAVFERVLEHTLAKMNGERR